MKNILILILAISLTFTFGCVKSDESNIDNPFFFDDSVTEIDYKGNFLFDDIIEEDVKLYINIIDNLKYGKLYQLKMNSIDGVPDERLILGYFVVQQDKIYKINLTDGNLKELKASEELPNDSILMCQDEELKDVLNENVAGWHQYIVVNGDKREYHSYNNQVSTGYYETFIWEKNKGLIFYQSGFGAESESIELQLNNQ